MTPKEVYVNLKNYDFDVMNYPLGATEAEVCKEALRKQIYSQGNWIQIDETKCKCSECNVITLIAMYPRGQKNFCPNCGADMRGDIG